MSQARDALRWIGTVDCEGGPVLLVAPADYAKWTGSFPFELLEKRFPDDPRFANRRLSLHYWGQFTDRLPAPFREDGGHVFRRYDTGAEAKAKLAELRAAVEQLEPGIAVNVDETSGRVQFRTQNGEQMTAELAPSSMYDAAWQEHEGEKVWTHPLPQGEGLFYDIKGAGTAEVAVGNGHLVIVRTWLSGDDDTEAAEKEAIRAFVANARPSEKESGEMTFTSSRLIAVWSPIARVQLGHKTLEAYEAAMAGDAVVELSTERFRGVGQCFSIAPGRYRISVGHSDEEDDDDREWKCRWCRLTKVG